MEKKHLKQQKSFEIGGTILQPGETKVVHIPVTVMPQRSAFELKLRVFHGKLPGNRLFISSAIHGDELNGIEILRRLFLSPLIKNLRGTLIVIPIVNFLGVLIQSRYLPDRRDLNRSFPGSETGSSASQLAHTFLKEIVKKCTYGIDLHTGSNNRFNLPQIRCDFQSAEALKIALAFGAPVILKAKIREGSLREAAEKLGIPTLTYEGGEALRFNENVIRAGVHGILRVMDALGMIPPKKCSPMKESPVVSPLSHWIRSPGTGIFRTTCDLGKKVFKGDILGKVTDSLGLYAADVIASFDGIVIGRTQLPLVYQGDALFNVAWVPDPKKAEQVIEGFEEEEEFNPSLDDLSVNH